MTDMLSGWAALGYFLVISAATRQHFESETYPPGMYVISLLSLAGLFGFLVPAFGGDLVYPGAALGLILCAFALFGWAVRHSRSKRLSLAFDGQTRIDAIITSGPWTYVRHPFYLSYILFWLACAAGSVDPVVITAFVTLTFIYCYSALQEERALQAGRHGSQYLEYRKKTGFLLPRLIART
ncbi:isoprenylcysteine carboxylmethyltransferase family protein [Marivita sp. GX14005]|uniref:methyltransferase family protein n=1 Tax=Marivita sp. GX14005 TaxID=2942276 RepID=UPI002019274F|nr:isoprenylcysteine carboxylmethyltransferase family protein [Marivita sp. GX14005]MCL3883947.1 isoprenylcysteine carboxylmethyltransferase family protein [Marivita sp. GX14005]